MGFLGAAVAALRQSGRPLHYATSGFSSGAEDVARVRNAPLIVLIDGDRLTDLLIEHEIGVPNDCLVGAVRPKPHFALSAIQRATRIAV